ncbi:MAG TPA: hypothetical protein DIW51_11050 [Rhodospirillaceae bacterium]|nr:hypothetical protein [Rhodospirillaceae bacterium]
MVVLPMGPAASGDERIKAAGITVREEDGKILIDDVAFGSEAKKVGLDWDQEITHVLQPADQLNKYWVYLPALLILGLVVLAQKARIRKTSAQAA